MKIGVLGALVVVGPDGPVPVAGAKERVVLAHLVAHVGRAVAVEALIDSLWPEGPPETASKTLQSHVTRLRNALRAAQDGPTIVHEGRAYRLLIDPADVDAHQFAEQVAHGRSALAGGRASEAVGTLTDALALWRGPAYGEFGATVFGRAEATRLDDLRSAARELLWEARLAVGDVAPVIGELEAHVTAEPLRERAWALLVRAYAADGNQGAALDALARARRVLDEELGVTPGAELAALLTRVLAQDPSLLQATRSLPPGLTPAQGPLVGRASLMQVLLDTWRTVQSGEGARVWLVGPPGSGRWRLACELGVRVHDAGDRVTDESGAGTWPGALVVVDRRGAREGVPLPELAPGTLQVVAAERADAAVGEDVVPIPELDVEDVAALLVWYDPSSAADPRLDDIAVGVLRRSGGLAGPATDLAMRWARDQVAGRVAVLTEAGEESARRVLGDRTALASGVEQWAALHGSVLAESGNCPWRGLPYYEPSDAHWFAGRERLTAELVARVATDRALLLVGDSGAGKSSVLRAGLVASLAAGALPGSEEWACLILRPGADPSAALAGALGLERLVPQKAMASVARLIREGGAARVVIVVDQLDECWTACDDPGSRTIFLATLAELATADVAVSLVLAVRSDHAGHLAEERVLSSALAGSTVLVGPMVETELRRAIEVPAARAGLVLQDGLVDALVEDTVRQPGGLPLLSAALVDLWDSRQAGALTLATYVATGGVSGAIARVAERAFADFDRRHQAACKTLFRRLVGPGAGGTPARRRVLPAELLALADPAVAECVDPLISARLLTASDGYLEIAHESLLGSWPRLRDWLADDAAAHATALRLAMAAHQWDADGREDADLWAGARLASACDLAAQRPEALTDVERAFVAAGEQRARAEQEAGEQQLAQARRQNTRLRWATALTGASLAVSIVAGSLGMQSRSEARDAERSAVAKQLAAVALNEPDLTRRMLTAVEAVRTEASPDTFGALLSVLDEAGPLAGSLQLEGRVSAMAGAAASPRAAAATDSGQLLVLDRATGERSTLSLVDNSDVRRIAVSPDGRLAAVTITMPRSDYNARVALIDLTTGRQLWVVGLHSLPGEDLDAHPTATALAFTDTSDGLVVLTRQGLVVVDLAAALDGSATYEPGSGPESGHGRPRLPVRLIRAPELQGPPRGQIHSLGSDRYLVIGHGETGQGAVVDLTSGGVEGLTAAGLAGTVGGAGGQVLATWGSPDGIAPGLQLTSLSGPGWTNEDPVTVDIPPVASAAFTPDATTLIAGGADGSLRFVDMASGTVQRTVAAHDRAISAVVIDSEGVTAWTSGADGALRAWDLENLGGLPSARPVGAPVTTARQSEDGRVAAVLSGSDGARSASVLEMTTGTRLIGPIPGPGSPSTVVASSAGLTPDGGTLVVGLAGYLSEREAPPPGYLDNHGMQIIDMSTREVRTTVDLPGPARGISVSPDGRTAAAVGEGGLAVVDLTDGRVVDRVGLTVDARFFPERPATVEYSPDGRRLAVGHDMGDNSPRISVFDADTLDPISSWSPGVGEQIAALVWTGNMTLAHGGSSGRLTFRSVEDGSALGQGARPTSGAIFDLAVSPELGLLAGLSDDGRIWLWSLPQQRMIGRPLAATAAGDVGALSFHGSELELLTQRGQAIRYPLAIDDLIERACRLASREPTGAEWLSMHGDAPQRPTCGVDGESIAAPLVPNS